MNSVPVCTVAQTQQASNNNCGSNYSCGERLNLRAQILRKDSVRLLGLADDPEIEELRSLANRTSAAATKLIRYLEHAEEP